MAKKFYFFTFLCVLLLMTGAFIHSQDKKQEVYKWKVVSVYPSNIPIFNDGIQKFADDIKAISNGQLDIQFYPAREFIKDIKKSLEPGDVFDAVSKGTVEMGFGAPIYWTEKVPGCEFMYAVPFGLSRVGMDTWLSRGKGLELMEELFAKHNIIPLPMGAAGGAMGGWFRKEIKEISDFKNLKIRMSGFHAKVYGKLGAKKHWMVGDEALDAFEKGDIDAIVCQGPFHDQGHKFHKVCQNYYYPGWQEPGAVLALIINKKALESLPPHLRKIIDIVRGSIDQYIYNQFITADSVALQELRNQGVKILKFPKPVIDRLRQLSTEIMEEEAKKDPQFKRVYEAYKTFKQHHYEYQWIQILDEAVR